MVPGGTMHHCCCPHWPCATSHNDATGGGTRREASGEANGSRFEAFAQSGLPDAAAVRAGPSAPPPNAHHACAAHRPAVVEPP